MNFNIGISVAIASCLQGLFVSCLRFMTKELYLLSFDILKGDSKIDNTSTIHCSTIKATYK
jgi:hypothetical protein